MLKSSSRACHVHTVSAGLDTGCRNEKLTRPLSHSLSGSKEITTDESVAVYTNEHQVITKYSGEVEHCSANSEISSEKPINITDGLSPVASESPHTNSEQVVGQEMTNPRCNEMLQPLPLPPTYHAHSIQNSQYHLQLPMLNNTPDFVCCNSDHHLEVPQMLINENKSGIELFYADMERGPLYYNSHYGCKTLCEHSIQETFHRPGYQELVFSHSITFCQSSQHGYKSTHYTFTELSALERPELYIKPFIALAPE